MNTGSVTPRRRGCAAFLRRSAFRSMNTRADAPGRPRTPRMLPWYHVRDAANVRRTAMEGRSTMLIDLDSMTQEQFERYRDECDARSAAEFRMRRELCGIELAEIAEDLGVRLDTAKRWENPNKGMPPSLRAWAYVDSAYLALLDAVEAAVGQVEDAAEAMGEPREVHVAYRRGNQPTRDGLTVGRSNAIARASALALTVLGYEASAEWADEGAAGPAARAPRG